MSLLVLEVVIYNAILPSCACSCAGFASAIPMSAKYARAERTHARAHVCAALVQTSKRVADILLNGIAPCTKNTLTRDIDAICEIPIRMCDHAIVEYSTSGGADGCFLHGIQHYTCVYSDKIHTTGRTKLMYGMPVWQFTNHGALIPYTELASWYGGIVTICHYDRGDQSSPREYRINACVRTGVYSYVVQGDRAPGDRAQDDRTPSISRAVYAVWDPNVMVSAPDDISSLRMKTSRKWSKMHDPGHYGGKYIGDMVTHRACRNPHHFDWFTECESACAHGELHLWYQKINIDDMDKYSRWALDRWYELID